MKPQRLAARRGAIRRWSIQKISHPPYSLGASSSAQTFSLQVITHYLAVLLTANLSCLSNRLTYRIAQTNN